MKAIFAVCVIVPDAFILLRFVMLLMIQAVDSVFISFMFSLHKLFTFSDIVTMAFIGVYGYRKCLLLLL